MKKTFFIIICCLCFVLNATSSSDKKSARIELVKLENSDFSQLVIEENESQCVPSWRWIGDDFCNINVRVDNPCNRRAYFYIVLNNCVGSNCIRCYYVNPGSFINQPINWCDGGTFYWGTCQ